MVSNKPLNTKNVIVIKPPDISSVPATVCNKRSLSCGLLKAPSYSIQLVCAKTTKNMQKNLKQSRKRRSRPNLPTGSWFSRYQLRTMEKLTHKRFTIPINWVKNSYLLCKMRQQTYLVPLLRFYSDPLWKFPYRQACACSISQINCCWLLKKLIPKWLCRRWDSTYLRGDWNKIKIITVFRRIIVVFYAQIAFIIDNRNIYIHIATAMAY